MFVNYSKTYFCAACGKHPTKWVIKRIISDDLAVSWRLTNDLRSKFDLRESQFCPYCRNSTRTRILAQTIINKFPVKGIDCLSGWIYKMKKKDFAVAEINSCGNLHPILKKLPGLAYSEYPSSRLLPKTYYFLKRTRKEDITNLSYSNNSFDLVLHSDVLEHIPDIKKTLDETRRILKPKGVCLFTAPYIPNRKTRQCAKIDKKTGKILYLKAPSFHGLDTRRDNMVLWEFGKDFFGKHKIKIEYSLPELLTYVFSIEK